jgi:hypothetical protein
MNQGVIGFGAGSSNQNLMGLDPTTLMAGSSNLQTLVPEGNVEVNKLIESIRANIMMFGMIRDDIKYYVCKRDGLDINSEDWLSAGRMITKSEVLSIGTYQWTSTTERTQIEIIFDELSSELNERMFNVANGSENGKVLVKRNGSAPHSIPVNEGLPNLIINNNPQSNLIQPTA